MEVASGAAAMVRAVADAARKSEHVVFAAVKFGQAAGFPMRRLEVGMLEGQGASADKAGLDPAGGRPPAENKVSAAYLFVMALPGSWSVGGGVGAGKADVGAGKAHVVVRSRDR